MANSPNAQDEFIVQAVELLDQSMIKLENCFSQLDENQIWWRPSSGLNSIGNVILHMCGNLRQWSVAALTQLPDERQRDAEFTADGNFSKSELWNLLRSTVDDAKQTIANTCDGVDGRKITEEIVVQGFDVSLCQAILHTTTHFVGHTHQVILLTRIQLGGDYRFAWKDDGTEKRLPI